MYFLSIYKLLLCSDYAALPVVFHFSILHYIINVGIFMFIVSYFGNIYMVIAKNIFFV